MYWCFDCFHLYICVSSLCALCHSNSLPYTIPNYLCPHTEARAGHTQGVHLAGHIVHSCKQRILLCCNTNHALDQFLEAILAHYPNTNMLRIGGKYKSKVLEPYRLRTQQTSSRPDGLSKSEHRHLCSRKHERNSHERQRSELCDRLSTPRTWIDIFQFLTQICPYEHSLSQKSVTVSCLWVKTAMPSSQTICSTNGIEAAPHRDMHSRPSIACGPLAYPERMAQLREWEKCIPAPIRQSIVDHLELIR
jgi:hypothetical protein